MKIADFVAGRLYDAGVRYVFGLPGGPSIPYMEAFRASGIEFILTSNEAAAGTMADITARLTGIPGICHATFGPGATNISTGTGEALLDRSPVIVFTSEVSDLMLERTIQMGIDHQKLFEAITKKSFRLNPGNTMSVLNSALSICREELPGPVHIGLPSDIAGKEVNEAEKEEFDAAEPGFKNDIDGICELLKDATHPLLALGLTAARRGLKEQILALLEKIRIPVVITPMAKGLIPENHPCYAGVLFHALSDCLEDLFAQTDLVIGLGYDPVEYNYESWMPDVPLIHFCTLPVDMPEGKNIIQYAGKPEEWFSFLERSGPFKFCSGQSVIEEVRQEMDSVFKGFLGHFGPVTALKILREELPVDTIISVDVGSHLHLAGQYWNTPSPEKFLITNGWSSMGFGIPAALSAQLNKPGSTVVCLTGDGGFLMMAGELVTALRYHLPVIIVVFSDGELNLIRLKQSWKEIPPYGTQLYSGDLFRSDTFLGVKVLAADNTDRLKKAVITALSLDEPVIINAIIDPDDYNWLVVRQK